MAIAPGFSGNNTQCRNVNLLLLGDNLQVDGLKLHGLEFHGLEFHGLEFHGLMPPSLK
jgi:hypothetical protein